MANARIGSHGIMRDADSLLGSSNSRSATSARNAKGSELRDIEKTKNNKEYINAIKEQSKKLDELIRATGQQRRTWESAAKENKKDRVAKRKAEQDELAVLNGLYNNSELSLEERKKVNSEFNKLAHKQHATSAIIENFFNSFTDLSKSLDRAAKEQIGYLSKLDTRLYGSGKNFSSLLNMVEKNVGVNAYIKQSKVFEKLNDYVSQGIAFNVEQRAFLGTVSEKIASTFEANNNALLQIIKIQQADSTAARLGMESTLTQFLNSNFKDTSYLNSLSDSVTSSLVGASSQLSRDGSIAFEYQVQKWLGSLSSVGVSDSTIQSLAQGINALGTGDINSLSGNSALQNLLVMSANTAGLNYSKLLTDGMNANTTNLLMRGMVDYLGSVAASQNQVVKSQYANLFGITISDLTSILNLIPEKLDDIQKSVSSYSSTISETENRLKTLYQRTSAGEMAENIFGNVMWNAGKMVTQNVGAYLTYLGSTLAGDTLNQILGETKVSPMGVGTSFKAGDILKGTVAAAFTGAGLVSQLLSASNRSFGNVNTNLNSWGASDTNLTSRGLSETLADRTTGKGLSQAVYIGNSDTSALYKSSLLSAEEQNEEIKGVSPSADTAESVSKINDVIADSIDPTVKAIRDILETWDIRGLRVRTSAF